MQDECLDQRVLECKLHYIAQHILSRSTHNVQPIAHCVTCVYRVDQHLQCMAYDLDMQSRFVPTVLLFE